MTNPPSLVFKDFLLPKKEVQVLQELESLTCLNNPLDTYSDFLSKMKD